MLKISIWKLLNSGIIFDRIHTKILQILRYFEQNKKYFINKKLSM